MCELMEGNYIDGGKTGNAFAYSSCGSGCQMLFRETMGVTSACNTSEQVQ
jgi:hypothetical protein